jgi:hypothetical protein
MSYHNSLQIVGNKINKYIKNNNLDDYVEPAFIQEANDIKLLDDIVSRIRFIERHPEEKKQYDEVVEFMKKKKIGPHDWRIWYGFEKGKLQKISSTPYINYNFYEQTKGIPDTNFHNPFNLWKLWINVRISKFAYVFKKIINTMDEKNVNYTGKIHKLSLYDNIKRNLTDCQNPRFLFYFYSQKELFDFSQIIHNIFKTEIDQLYCDIGLTNSKYHEFPINNKIFSVEQKGPSFTKDHNKLIFYGQSGFSESKRQDLSTRYSNVISTEIDYLKIKLPHTTIDLDRRALKIQKYILNTLYDGENFYKTKGFLNPLESSHVRQEREELTQKSNNVKSMETRLHSLMFTHNTNIETFLIIMTEVDRNLKYMGDRGVQFRYGLDSQYGDIKFIMKKNNYLLKKVADRTKPDDVIVKGVDPVARKQIDNPFHYDFWNNVQYEYNNKENKKLNEKLHEEAQQYDFRSQYIAKHGQKKNHLFDEKSGYVTTSNCAQKNKPSWCNIQLHIGSDVSLRHVECVLVPGFVMGPEFNDIIKADSKFTNIFLKETVSDMSGLIKKYNNELVINGRINYLYNKILIINENNDISKHYSFIRSSNNYLNEIQECYKVPGQYDTTNKDMLATLRCTSNMCGGNSSILATSLPNFTNEEKMYMKILLYNNCFLEKSKFDLHKVVQKLRHIEQDETLSESDSDSD